KRIAETLGGGASPVVDSAIRDYVHRAVRERLPDSAWGDERWSPLLARAWGAAWQGEGPPPLPAGVGPEILPPGGEAGSRRFEVWQVDCGLSFTPVNAVPGIHPATGSPLAEVESGNGQVSLHEEGARWATPRPLGEGLDLPRASSFVLRTDRSVATFRRITRPEWANAAMGRDRYGLWASFEIGGVEQRMRWIPPGRFLMGSPEDEPGRYGDEGPRLLEPISEGFWLGETPCTQALWEAVMKNNPSRFKTADRPVEQVSWEDCREFLEKLGWEKDDQAWRLPTEAEWEYACRAGTE